MENKQNNNPIPVTKWRSKHFPSHCR